MRQRQKTKLGTLVAAGLLAVGGLGGMASATDQPKGDAEQDGFRPMSSSWTSAEVGYVLGWQDCAEQGACAVLLSTQDGGESWTELAAPDLEPPDQAVRIRLFFTEQGGTTVGVIQNGLDGAYTSYDGGETWQAEDFADPTETWEVSDVAATPSHVYALLNGSDDIDSWAQLYRLPVGEQTWQPVDETFHLSGYQGELAARGNTAAAWFYATEHAADAFYTTTDGEKWTQVDPYCYPDGGAGFASGGKGRLYLDCEGDNGRRVDVSDDGGKTFETVGTAPEQADLAGAAFGDTVVFGSETSCELHSSFDGGASWQVTYSGQGSLADDIQLTNDGTGSALCGSSAVLRTTDGGQSWQPVDFG